MEVLNNHVNTNWIQIVFIDTSNTIIRLVLINIYMKYLYRWYRRYYYIILIFMINYDVIWLIMFILFNEGLALILLFMVSEIWQRNFLMLGQCWTTIGHINLTLGRYRPPFIVPHVTHLCRQRHTFGKYLGYLEYYHTWCSLFNQCPRKLERLFQR